MANNKTVTGADGEFDVATLETSAGLNYPLGPVAYATSIADGASVVVPVTSSTRLPVELSTATITSLTPPAAITGFATAANQTTIISALTSISNEDFASEATLNQINLKTPSLGQALAANSVPVVLTAAQLASLTPPAFYPITDNSGSITVDAPATTPVFVRLSTGSAAIDTIPTSATVQAGTSGGWTPSHLLTAATNNATSLKASAGQVGGWVFSNANASTRYVKFYNKASAPSPGSDTPVYVVAVPGGSASAPTVVTSNNAVGLTFSTGIAFAVVAGMSNTDNTSATAGDMTVGIIYK